MRALALLTCAVAIACAPPPDPELQTRATVRGTNPDVPPQDAPDLTNSEFPADAGRVEVDAGICCTVRFALSATSDERRASFTLYPSYQSWPMSLEGDGGVWSVEACVPMRSSYYYFDVGLQTDEEDGGLFPITRVNRAVPSVGNAVVPELNVFEPGAAETCGGLDAGVYSELPDAG